MPPLPPNLHRATIIKTIPAWEQKTMARRDTHTRHISSHFPSQPSKDTSWVNPSLPPGASRLAQPKGSIRVPQSLIPSGGESGWFLVDQWMVPRNLSADVGSLFIPDSNITSFVVGLPNAVGEGEGQVIPYLYNNSTDEFDVIGTTLPTPNTGDPGESFGKAVVMTENANVIIVGEPRATNSSTVNAGRLYAFELVGDAWVEKFTWFSDEDELSAGYSLDISVYDEDQGKWYLVVGEPMFYSEGTGNPRITSWEIPEDLSGETKYNTAGNSDLKSTEKGSRFALSVANGNNGTAAVIGVPELSTDAIIRVISNGPETFDTTQDIAGPGGSSTFGSCVDMSRDGTIVVAGDPGLGQVRVYYKNEADDYVPLGSTLSGDAGFGTSVAVTNDSSNTALDGTMIAIGDPNYSSALLPNCGRIAVMEYAGGNWVQVYSNILGTSENEYFGTVVAISPEGLGVIGLSRQDKGRYAVYSTYNQAERQENW